MAVKPPKAREPFTPCPAGVHKAVWVDVYYTWDAETEWEGKPNIKDFVHFALEIDPATAGMTKVRKLGVDLEVPFWVTARFTVAGERYDEGGSQIMREDYVQSVLRNPANKIPVAMDDNGEPHIFIGTRHTVYKMLLGYGGKAFQEAYAKGTISLEKLIGKNCKLVIKHGEPDKNGQVWPRVQDIWAPEENQDLKPSGHYVRVKDRKDDEGEDVPLPF